VSTTNTQQSSSSSASVNTNTPPHTLKVEASLRPSRVSADNAHTQTHTQTHTPIPEEGSLVQGFVCNVSASGCFIRLAHDLTGVCLLKELSDTFVHNPKEQFPVGKLVQARVLSVSASASSEQTHTQHTHNIKLSLKTSAIEGDAKLIALYNSFEVGSIVEGTVKQVTDFGVFVTLSSAHTQTNTQKQKSTKKQRTDSADRPQEIVGLSRKMHAVNYDPSHEQNVDLTHTYKVGDVVQAKILSVNPGTRKIALGLKPSYFKDVNEEDDEDDEDNDGEEEEEEDMDEQTDEDEEEDEDEDDEDDEEEEEEGNIRMLGSDEEDDDGDYEDEELERMIKEAALHSDDDEDDDEEEEEEEPVSVQKKKAKKDEPAAETSSSKKRKAVVASAVVSDDEEVSDSL
jgi:rRNA biogenesis protein RRP5